MINRYVFDIKMLPFGGSGIAVLVELGLMNKWKPYLGHYFWFEFMGTEVECSVFHHRLNTEQSIFKVIGVHRDPDDTVIKEEETRIEKYE